MMDIEHDMLLTLGRIEGISNANAKRLEELTSWLGQLDKRLRAVEIKSALWGLAGGGCSVAAMQWIAEHLK